MNSCIIIIKPGLVMNVGKLAMLIRFIPYFLFFIHCLDGIVRVMGSPSA